MTTALDSKSSDRQWFIVGRWQEYDGESRANLLRIIAVGAFYIVQLIQYYGVQGTAKEGLVFHQQATALAVAWSLIALAVLLCLRRRIFPAALKFVSTGCDIVLLTSLASVTETKALGPLTYVFFLIVALSGLRFNLPLVWCATLGSMIGYMCLVGMTDTTWFNGDHAVPVVQQLIVLLSLGLSGIMLGQIIRRVKGIAQEYAQRMQALEKGSS